MQRNLRRRNYRKRDPGAGAILLLILVMLLAQSEPERQQVRIYPEGVEQYPGVLPILPGMRANPKLDSPISEGKEVIL